MVMAAGTTKKAVMNLQGGSMAAQEHSRCSSIMLMDTTAKGQTKT